VTPLEPLISKPSLDSYITYSNAFRCLGHLDNAIKIQEQQINLTKDNSTIDIPIIKDLSPFALFQGKSVQIDVYL